MPHGGCSHDHGAEGHDHHHHESNQSCSHGHSHVHEDDTQRGSAISLDNSQNFASNKKIQDATTSMISAISADEVAAKSREGKVKHHHHHEENINIRAAVVHVIGDML